MPNKNPLFQQLGSDICLRYITFRQKMVEILTIQRDEFQASGENQF